MHTENESGMEKFDRSRRQEPRRAQAGSKVQYFLTTMSFSVQGMQDSGCDEVDGCVLR